MIGGYQYMNWPKFMQLQMFASELLLLLDKEICEEISDVCDYVEKGKIVEFFSNKHSFQNREVNSNSINAVNEILKKYYVSETVAHDKGIEVNGIVFLLQIIQEIYSNCMYSMKMNEMEPDYYGDYFN